MTDTIEIPACLDDMTADDRRFVEFAAAWMDRERRSEEMRAKLAPIDASYVPASYGDQLTAAELGGIGNLLFGAAGILRRIAMLPNGTIDAYPEWERAVIDAAETKAAAEACWAEQARRSAEA